MKCNLLNESGKSNNNDSGYRISFSKLCYKSSKQFDGSESHDISIIQIHILNFIGSYIYAKC